MRHDFTVERRVILFGVVALVAADIALAGYGWNRRFQQDLALATRNRDLLRADISRAQDIRQRMPAILRAIIATSKHRIFFGERGTQRDCKQGWLAVGKPEFPAERN
jgi:hypothetical protein